MVTRGTKSKNQKNNNNIINLNDKKITIRKEIFDITLLEYYRLNKNKQLR